MKKNFKKFKNSKKVAKTKHNMTKPEFKSMLSGLTDDELSQVSCWLLARQQKP